MKLKPTNIEINDENPFQNDVLDRKESAEILSQLIQNISNSFVLCIDSPWGNRKNYFYKDV